MESRLNAINGTASLDRRSLLRTAILLVGGSLTSLPVEALAQAAAKAPRYFNKAEFAVLDEVCAIIIPRTDTPGAREAGVPGFIDALMSDWAAPQTAQETRDVVNAIDASAKASQGKLLLGLTPAKRLEAVRAFDAAELPKSRGYRRFKELLMLAYYSSEAGATQELRYELAPGVWEASVPLKPGQPAWAV